MPHVRSATPEDCDSLASRLRFADQQELRAVGEFDNLAALLRSVNASDFPMAIIGDDGLPVAVFGTAPTIDPLVGSVWLLGSDDLSKYRTRFLRECRRWVDAMHTRYPVLANAVHENNSLHIRWLRWLGFVFLKRHQIGQHGFLEFARLQPCVKPPLSPSLD